ncbi:unnamed protein product, partial [Porites evermanni]
FQKVILHSLTGDDGDYGGIHIKCISQYMQLTLEKVHYKKIDPESLRLRDPRCKVAFYNKTIMVIRAPLGNCGTTSATEGKLIRFTNDVYAEVSGSSAISRAPAYQFRLECLYYASVKISLHSFKAEDTIIVTPTPGKCIGKFKFETSMYQTNKYISKYTQFPVKVHLGESIYLQVNLKSNQSGLSLLLENCRATPTKNPNDTTYHTLIKDGCPVDEHLNYKNSDSPYQRFSFQSFKFNNTEVVYLHCEVYVCANNTNCSEGCTQEPGNIRRRRDKRSPSDHRRSTSLQGAVKILTERVQGAPLPIDEGSRSYAPVVTIEKLLILLTFTLACFSAL